MTHAQAVETAAAERYLLDEMSELERHAFESHYFSCLECAEDVRAGGMMREGVEAGLMASHESGVRSRVSVVGSTNEAAMKARPWKPSVVIPWAIAATLAVGIGYQSLIVGPSASLRPQALNPVTLRAASRGAEAIVPVRSDATVVTLVVDVSTSTVELVYDLRTAGDRSVASGSAQAPTAGAPLLLLVPASTLSPGQRYSLTVRHASTGELIGDFRFSVIAQ